MCWPHIDDRDQKTVTTKTFLLFFFFLHFSTFIFQDTLLNKEEEKKTMCILFEEKKQLFWNEIYAEHLINDFMINVVNHTFLFKLHSCLIKLCDGTATATCSRKWVYTVFYLIFYFLLEIYIDVMSVYIPSLCLAGCCSSSNDLYQ